MDLYFPESARISLAISADSRPRSAVFDPDSEPVDKEEHCRRDRRHKKKKI